MTWTFGGPYQLHIPAAADLAALRAGQVARPGRPGVGAILAGARVDRGRALPDRRLRRGRRLAAADAAPGAADRAGRDAQGDRHDAATRPVSRLAAAWIIQADRRAGRRC